MTWVLSIIILLALCHRFYSYDYKSVIRRTPRLEHRGYYNEYSNYESPHSNINRKYNRYAALRQHNKRNGNDINPSSELTTLTTPNSKLKSEKDSNLWHFELDLPKALRSLKQLTGITVTADTDPTNPQAATKKPGKKEEDSILSQKLLFEVEPPKLGGVMSYLNKLMNSEQPRRASLADLMKEKSTNHTYMRYVEEAPGVVKSIQMAYPPRYQEGRLKTLLRIKEKMKKVH